MVEDMYSLIKDVPQKVNIPEFFPENLSQFLALLQLTATGKVPALRW